jgi:diacylglycerol kinase (ATP)
MKENRGNLPSNQLSRKGHQKMPRQVFVVINPATGPEKPILKTLNKVFQENGVEWDIAITKERGDGKRLAYEASMAGSELILVYGGDGTVMECASGLISSQTPLAILPGGTANVMARELGLPSDLEDALAVAINPQSKIRSVDMGQIGEQTFLLRAGVGFEAEMVKSADRELKDRFGILAYAISALQALADIPVARYRLCLDGVEVDSEGLACIVANSGNLGVQGIVLSPKTNISDGLLDVFVVTKTDLPSLVVLAGSVIGGRQDPPALQHWQVRELTIDANPRQTVQVDGEIIGQTPVTIEILPKAVQIVVPPD